MSIPKLLTMLLILSYASYTHLPGSPYYYTSSSIDIVGDLTLRFYPDKSIGVRLKAEGIRLEIGELGGLRFRIKTETDEGCHRYMLNASLLSSKTYRMIANYSFNSNWIFKGSRDEVRFSFDISISRVDGVNITSTSIGKYVKVTRFFETLSNITISLSYASIGFNQTTVEGFIKILPTIESLYEALISISSKGELSLKLQFEHYTVEADRCILYFSSRFSGSLIGLRRLLESNIKLPILSDILESYGSPVWNIISKLYFDAVDKASELRYAWMKSGSIHYRMEDGLTNISGIFEFSGDVDRHATEILWTISNSIDDIRGCGVLTEILKYPTKISIKGLDVDIRLEGDTLDVYVSGVKLIDIDPYNLLRMLSDLSRRIPMNEFTLSLEGSSNSTMIVELSMPDIPDGISKPVKIEGRHRIVWVFRSLESIDKVELHSVRNLVGISDLTYYEYRFDGKLYVLKIYTNSTLISDPILRSDSLTLTVRGGGRFIEAFNVSIPNSLPNGIVACISDNSTYMKPMVSKSLGEYWIYLSYPPSMRSIGIVWGEPEFRVEADREDLDIGDEVKMVGVLRIRGVGLKGENVTLIVDGEPIAEIPVTDDGTFTYSFKPIKPGVMDLWVRYSSQGLTYETGKIKITVSSYESPYITMITAAIATISLTTIFILHKRRPSYLRFLKRF
ncbi:MAG: hypothetical protein QXQ29_00585 [Candidatus Bathyarchaeia archaeon]